MCDDLAAPIVEHPTQGPLPLVQPRKCIDEMSGYYFDSCITALLIASCVVGRWNRRRQSKNQPHIRLDSADYEGRLTIWRWKEMMKSGKEIGFVINESCEHSHCTSSH